MIDGFGIRSLYSAFFFKFMPDVIKEGRLYVAVPPLYRVDDKRNPFVVDKQEYTERFIKKLKKAFKVKIHGETLEGDELYEFAWDTKNYPENLTELAKHFQVNKKLLEMTCSFMASCGDNPTIEDVRKLVDKHGVDFQADVQNHFGEMFFDFKKMRLYGNIGGKYQILDLTERLITKTRKKLFPIYIKYGHEVSIKEKGDEKAKWNKLNICEFYEYVASSRPKIITRFKGLGENDPEELWETTLNPDTRTLIQLTIDDYDADMETFLVLHGTGSKYAQARHDMMQSYTIDPDNLDN